MRAGEIFLSLSLCALLGAGPAQAADAPTSPGTQVVEEATASERRLLDELDALEKAIDAAESAELQLQHRTLALKKQQGEKKKERLRLEQALEAQKAHLAQRLRAVYRLKEGGLIQLLLSADSLEDLLRRYRYFSIVIAHDERILEEHHLRRLALGEAMARIRSQEDGLKNLLAQEETEKQKLSQARSKKTALLMTVHERKETYLALERERETSRENLVKEVILEPAQKAGSEPAPEEKPAAEPKTRQWPDLSALRGKLPLPVEGRVRDRFGQNPGLFGTYTTRLGLTIEAKGHSPARPVAPGEIVYASWLRGYGNVVIIDHGGRYYTLTAGLADLRVRPGQWVEPGDPLGVVPDSGKMERKEIYFEIRLRGKALDPGPWLAPATPVQAERGEK